MNIHTRTDRVPGTAPLPSGTGATVAGDFPPLGSPASRIPSGDWLSYPEPMLTVRCAR